ncbi:MAG: PIN domain-containing protein [Ignavibacteriae bacterium]|nr:PIN domain-containing protein [Ignavibacteriota bacterium]
MKFYADTSAWGGYEDEEFAEWTVPFFEQAREGKFIIVLSDVTLRELADAPAKVQRLPETIPSEFLELVEIDNEQLDLAQKYIIEGALTSKYEADAQHIAIATTLKVESLISWNFKHMVNFFRIRQYNAVNLKYGYSTIDIRTPKEIIYADKQ